MKNKIFTKLIFLFAIITSIVNANEIPRFKGLSFIGSTEKDKSPKFLKVLNSSFKAAILRVIRGQGPLQPVRIKEASQTFPLRKLLSIDFPS